MDDCDSEVLLSWIDTSKRLKMPDDDILDGLIKMLENIRSETRASFAKAAGPQQQTQQIH